MPKTAPRQAVIDQVVEVLRECATFTILAEDHEGEVRMFAYPQHPDEEQRERDAAKLLAEYSLMILGKWRQKHAMDNEDSARAAGRFGLPGTENINGS